MLKTALVQRVGRTSAALKEKYSQLISLGKTANNSCTMYLCKVVPRGDVDISAFNHTIQRLADQWVTRQAPCIQEI